jgi:hypothetical protein
MAQREKGSDGTVPDASTPPIIAGTLDSTAVLSVLGRTLLVLGGAFLLRALTDSGTIRPALGVGLGLAYALFWMLLADRAGRSGHGLSAGFHGIAFVLIALPLVVEATSRFHLLNPTWSAAALLALVAIALAVAARRRGLALAWVTTLGALLAAAGLAFLTGRIAPYAAVLVVLGGIALWFGYVLDWFLLRWPAAVAADLVVLTLGLRSVTEGVSDTPAAALFVQILFLSTYLGSIAARTLFLNRDVVPFEVIQSVATIAIGLGGAAHVTRASGAGGTALAVASLVLGAGCYAVALAFVERRQGRRKNFYFYTSAALVFTLAGCGLLLGRGPLALAWVALALLGMMAGRWSGRLTFHVHGAAYAIAAAIASGLVVHEARGLGLPVKASLEPSGVQLAVLAVCGAGVLLLCSEPAVAARERPAAAPPARHARFRGQRDRGRDRGSGHSRRHPPGWGRGGTRRHGDRAHGVARRRHPASRLGGSFSALRRGRVARLSAARRHRHEVRAPRPARGPARDALLGLRSVRHGADPGAAAAAARDPETPRP